MRGTKTPLVEEASAHNQINTDTQIIGNIRGKGSYRIDGQLEGNIDTPGKVVIGEKGKITGIISCGEAVICGTVVGTIKASDLVTLEKSSYVEGEIQTGKLSVEVGANLNGTCKMKKLNTKNTPSLTENINNNSNNLKE